MSSHVNRRPWLGPVLVLALNAAIIGLALTIRQTVLPSWKKGPLVDPAAPYSPENAQLLFSIGACLALDVYFGVLALWRRHRPARWWVPGIALALGAVAAEGALRTWLAFDMVTTFRPDAQLHWVVRPNLVDLANIAGDGHITTNADGMREVTEPRAKPPGQFRILVLGDSSNFGHGVEGDQMWSSVLQGLLRSGGNDIVVLNGAVPGWTTYQARIMLERYGLAYAPDLVLAGFNNDSGPDYLADAERALPPGPMRDLQDELFRSEFYLLSRETVLSLARRLGPDSSTYVARHPGKAPTYGDDGNRGHLVPRVGLDEFLANLEWMADLRERGGPRFAWINMPINRSLPELVDYYVDDSYREAARELASTKGFVYIDVDALWKQSGERDLHLSGHVFHPSVTGHTRMAEQIARELRAASLLPPGVPYVRLGGPRPRGKTLRLAWSSLTPVHAHVGVVLEQAPDLAAGFGLSLSLKSYDSGKTQGDDVARGVVDAFFSCEVPAIHMAASRPDTRIFASPGVLGRVAVVGRPGSTLPALRSVGLSRGSTPDMDWQTWGEGSSAVVVDLPTDDLLGALLEGTVDAVVSWDPWVEQWVQEHPELLVLAERPIRSTLAVSTGWAEVEEEGDPRARRLADLVAAALKIAAENRDFYDNLVARRSGWPLSVVRAVADRNEILAGGAPDLALTGVDVAGIKRAARWSGARLTSPLMAPELLRPPTASDE